MSNSILSLSRQVIRPNRLQAWVFVVGCGLSSMVGAGATALFMTPDPVRVLIPLQAPAVPQCHDLIVSTVIPRGFALEWFSAGAEEQERDGRLVPHVQDGEVTGLKLYGIRPHSIYDMVGLNNGDTILSVEGVNLMSPSSDRVLFQKIFAENKESVSVEILRRGCAARLEVGLF